MSTKSTNVRKESKFVRYMKGPVKILARARDFYVHSLTGCSGHVAYYGNAVGYPATCQASLPRSFSANASHNSNHSSRDDDMRELVRIASTRGLTGKSEAELLRSRKSPEPTGAAAVSRSRTVVIGRIDEDKPCEFGGNDVGEKPLLYPRSRSCATSGRSRMPE